MLTSPQYVVQTWYVERGRGHREPRVRDEYYRIELSPSRTDARAERLVLATRDPGIYQDALDAEGHDVRLVARWHAEGELKICDELLPAPAPLTPHERRSRS